MESEGARPRLVRRHDELEVFQRSFNAALRIHQLCDTFPRAEQYSLTDQIRRSSRSVAANIAEAWRKRRYRNHFVSKLGDAESEAAETQVWLQFAREFGYLNPDTAREVIAEYDAILGMLVAMLTRPDRWTL